MVTSNAKDDVYPGGLVSVNLMSRTRPPDFASARVTMRSDVSGSLQLVIARREWRLVRGRLRGPNNGDFPEDCHVNGGASVGRRLRMPSTQERGGTSPEGRQPNE